MLGALSLSFFSTSFGIIDFSVTDGMSFGVVASGCLSNATFDVMDSLGSVEFLT